MAGGLAGLPSYLLEGSCAFRPSGSRLVFEYPGIGVVLVRFQSTAAPQTHLKVKITAKTSKSLPTVDLLLWNQSGHPSSLGVLVQTFVVEVVVVFGVVSFTVEAVICLVVLSVSPCLGLSSSLMEVSYELTKSVIVA